MEDIRSATRVVGVDIARFVALAGMMATHILPEFRPYTDDLTVAQALAGGRASALFAVVAGVSLALATGGTSPVRGRAVAPAASGILVRALLIGLIGLVVGETKSGLAIILTYYAALFVLGIPFLALSASWLYALAAAWLVVSPVVAREARLVLPERGYSSPSFDSLEEPARLLSELTFTGYYPAVPWLAYLLLGLAIGRTDLTRWRTPALLAPIGALLAAGSVVVSDALLDRPGVRGRLAESVGASSYLDRLLAVGFPGSTPTDTWWWLAVRAPHSATPFDLAQTGGSALVVIAGCLVVGRLVPSVAAVVFGAGAMTLTLYTAHVLSRAGLWTAETMGTYAAQLAVATAIGAMFALAGRRGPLEAVVAAASRATQRATSV